MKTTYTDRAETAVKNLHRGTCIKLNQLLPGNLKSKAYEQIFIHRNCISISCDDDGYYAQAKARYGKGYLSQKVLARIAATLPALEEVGYLAIDPETPELDVEVHESPGGCGWWCSLVKGSDGTWGHHLKTTTAIA